MRIIPVYLATMTLLSLHAAHAATWYVATNGSDVAAGTNWVTARQTVQAAIDLTSAGDTVLVSNGVYATGGRVVRGVMTNRVAITTAITVRSVNGPKVTIIEGAKDPFATNGDAAVRCAYVGANATLTGFTLTKGATRGAGGVGVNELFDRYGGGVWSEADAVVSNCTLTGNSAYSRGGGAFFGTLNNCTVSGNTAGGIGGGSHAATLNNCRLTGNSADNGGAAYSGTLNNCTVSGNNSIGGGVHGCTLNNCIVYFNTASGGANHLNCTFNNSCTTPGPGGTASITNNPQFVDAATGNFHLLATSPCIDSGSNAYAVSPTDLDGNPRNVGGRVDMGAYEAGPRSFVTAAATGGTTTGSSYYFAGSDAVIAARGYSAHWSFEGWNDGGTTLVRTVTAPLTNITYTATFLYLGDRAVTAYVAIDSENPVWPYVNWATAATNIQDAIDVVLDGDAVIVSNGVYATGGRVVNGAMTNRAAITNAITVRSVNGPTVTSIVGAKDPLTTNGDAAVRCVYVAANATLTGFTLTNGATRGAGIGFEQTTGGGVFCRPGGVVNECVLSGNSAFFGGGGAWFGTLNNCTFSGNACRMGGGAYGGTLNNCKLTGNSADYGGAASGGPLNNCTVSGNHSIGGAVYGCTLNNCIVYLNMASGGANHLNCTFINSCTTPDPGGTANITNNPQFVDAATGNFRLQAGSPCIDTGNNAYVSGATDLDGHPRIVHRKVDIGAYEFVHSLEDYDGDGMSNGDEDIADTDPTDETSSLRITAAEEANGVLHLHWQGGTQAWQYVEYRHDMVATSHKWRAIFTNVPPMASTTNWIEVEVSDGVGFYRIRASRR